MDRSLRRNRSRRLAATVALAVLGVLGGRWASAAAQTTAVRYRDRVFDRVERPNDIVYGVAVDLQSGQQVDLRLDLYEPRGDAETRRPVLMFVHGGGFVSGDKSAGQRWADEFARRGWVVASIGYRLRQGDLATVGIPAAVEDARQAMRWLLREAGTYRLDTTRVVAGGSSAGAITALFLTYTDVARTPADAASKVAGVMDLWGALYGQEAQMTAGEPPLIIVHGTEDDVVPYRYAEALRDRAARVGIPHEFHPLEGVGHGSGETAEISAWTAEFLYPLLWVPEQTVTVTSPVPSPTPPGSAIPSPTDSSEPTASPSARIDPTVSPATDAPSATAAPRPIRIHLPVALDRADARARPATARATVPSTSPPPTVPPVAGAVVTRSGVVVGTADGDAWR